jgi:hypothetical protein
MFQGCLGVFSGHEGRCEHEVRVGRKFSLPPPIENQPRQGRIERQAAIDRALIARADALISPQRVVLDLDSTEIPV